MVIINTEQAGKHVLASCGCRSLVSLFPFVKHSRTQQNILLSPLGTIFRRHHVQSQRWTVCACLPPTLFQMKECYGTGTHKCMNMSSIVLASPPNQLKRQLSNGEQIQSSTGKNRYTLNPQCKAGTALLLLF